MKFGFRCYAISKYILEVTKISEAVRVDVSRNRTRIHHCCHRCDWLCSGSSVPAGPEINQFTPVGRGRKQQRNGLVLRE